MSPPTSTRSIELVVFVLLAACSAQAQPAPAPAAPTLAHTTATLVAPPPGDEWTVPAGEPGASRYSTLDQLTPANVKNLRLRSTFTTGIPHGHEGQPLVVGGLLYVVTPYPNNLMAFDLASGKILWVFRPLPDPRAVGIACCDVVNRGAVYADGKIIYNLLDAHTVAVDARTGNEVWRTKVGEIALGETYTGAPLVAGKLVIVGNSGGELGVRGKIVALDVATGHEVWRAYSQGPDSDVRIGAAFKPFYRKDQGKDLGVSTWPPEQWKLGGGTVWGWMSYDPALGLLYHGTGNPGVWNPDLRPGSNHWSTTIFARDAQTGEARWAYQVTPHDSWDYDEIMESILVDMPWKGQPRKLLIHPARNGFVFVMDRLSGEVLSAEAFEPVTWARGYDLKTGLPLEDPAKRTHEGVEVRDICPSSTGGKEVVPSAFSPDTGLLYIPAHNTCMNYEGTEANYIAGTPYLGASVKMFPGPGGYQGELIAWDVASARKVWSIKEEELPVYSGVLVTRGGLVFYGTMDGWFRALDARTGEILWQTKLPSGIVGNPMTFTAPDGKQVVAVYAGVGGWMGAVAFPEISLDDPYAALGVVGAMQAIKHKTEAGDVVALFSL